MPWLLSLFLLTLLPLSAHIRYKWRGEEREWQGPFYEDEWPIEESQPDSTSHTICKFFYYCALLTCLGLLTYLLLAH